MNNGTGLSPSYRLSAKKTGRPRASERAVFEVILLCFIQEFSGDACQQDFLPKSTAHDYLRLWCKRDSFRHLFAALINLMLETGKLDLSKGFMDATFAAAKGGRRSGINPQMERH